MASPAAKKRKYMDGSSSPSAPRLPTQSSPVSSMRLDASKTNDMTQDTGPRGRSDCQPSTDEGVDATLSALNHRRAGLENMKDTITQHRGEKEKQDAAMETMKAMMEGMKRSVDELSEAAEVMQSRNRKLEATIEKMSSKNAAQELELEKLRLRAEVLQQDKVKALEGQASCRRRLAKLLWDHDPRDSATKSAKPVNLDEPGSEDREGIVTSSGPGAPGSAEQRNNPTNETNDELKQMLDQVTELSRCLEEKLRVANQELEVSLKREGALQNANETALKNHEDLKKQLADTITAHYQLAHSSHGTLAPENGPLVDGGAEVKAMRAREAQALEKAKQHKAHNMELKIARDVMRRKLLEVAAARTELETTLAQTKTNLAESQKALSESQTSYIAVKKTLLETETTLAQTKTDLAESQATYTAMEKAFFASDASFSMCRLALTKANKDLSKDRERYRELGIYADNLKSGGLSERDAMTVLLSRLVCVCKDVRDTLYNIESPNTPKEANGAIQWEVFLKAKSVLNILIALINSEVERHWSAWSPKGQRTSEHSSITSAKPALIPLMTNPTVIPTPPNDPSAHQQDVSSAIS